MEALLKRICEGENLNFEEMSSKYLKPKRAAKVETRPVENSGVCTATTAKGKPCSLKALAGTCFCRIHSGEPKPKKEKAPPKEKKPSTRSTEPVHNHPVDEELHDECELCQTHGAPFEKDEDEFEVAKSPKRSLRERLAAMDQYLSESDEE